MVRSRSDSFRLRRGWHVAFVDGLEMVGVERHGFVGFVVGYHVLKCVREC